MADMEKIMKRLEILDEIKRNTDAAIIKLDEVIQKVDVHEDRITSLEEENNIIRQEVIDLRFKADYQENQSRRNNLIFKGIPTQANETWEQTENIVKEFLYDKLGITCSELDIERAHRLNKFKGNDKPIVVKFTFYKLRQRIMKEKKKLKGTHFSISEDFSDRVLQERKNLLPRMKIERDAGKIAYLSFNKLKVSDGNLTKTYVYDWEIERIIDLSEATRPNDQTDSLVVTARKRPKSLTPPISKRTPMNQLKKSKPDGKPPTKTQDLRQWFQGNKETINSSQLLDSPQSE